MSGPPRTQGLWSQGPWGALGPHASCDDNVLYTTCLYTTMGYTTRPNNPKHFSCVWFLGLRLSETPVCDIFALGAGVLGCLAPRASARALGRPLGHMSFVLTMSYMSFTPPWVTPPGLHHQNEQNEKDFMIFGPRGCPRHVCVTISLWALGSLGPWVPVSQGLWPLGPSALGGPMGPMHFALTMSFTTSFTPPAVTPPWVTAPDRTIRNIFIIIILRPRSCPRHMRVTCTLCALGFLGPWAPGPLGPRTLRRPLGPMHFALTMSFTPPAFTRPGATPPDQIIRNTLGFV